MSAPLVELARYEQHVVQPFGVLEVAPRQLEVVSGQMEEETLAREAVLRACAIGVREVVESGWHKKFVPHSMLEDDLWRKMKTDAGQLAAIKEGGRYLLAVSGENYANPAQIEVADIDAILRVETYKPRFGRPYPNITDLESRSGKINDADTLHGQQARALVFTALRDTDSLAKVAAYTEAPNQDGIDFYASHNFRMRRTVEGEKTLPFDYVHMQARSAFTVRMALMGANPFIELEHKSRQK